MATISEGARPVESATGKTAAKQDGQKQEPATAQSKVKGALEHSGFNLETAPQEQVNFIVDKVMQVLGNVPGIAALISKAGKPKKAFNTKFNLAMQKYREKNPNDPLVTLRLKGTGSFGSHYNCALFSLEGVGDHDGIPMRIAQNLAAEYPKDFVIIDEQGV